LLSAARDRAAAGDEFEAAGQLHRRYEKLKAALEQKRDLVRNVHEFNGVALTWNKTKTRIQVWLMLKGIWQEPVTFAAPEPSMASGELGQKLYAKLSPMVAHPALPGDSTEHLALFSRWYYSSWREGTWHAFSEFKSSDCRRLARQILKLTPPAG
jgi:excinuclease ABC subunit C